MKKIYLQLVGLNRLFSAALFYINYLVAVRLLLCDASHTDTQFRNSETDHHVLQQEKTVSPVHTSHFLQTLKTSGETPETAADTIKSHIHNQPC